MLSEQNIILMHKCQSECNITQKTEHCSLILFNLLLVLLLVVMCIDMDNVLLKEPWIILKNIHIFNILEFLLELSAINLSFKFN